jgi:choline kinase
MKLIILAAGKGERLMPLTRNTPKSLLEIGGGVTLLEAQLGRAADAGIEDIVVVVGYRAEQIEAKIKGSGIRARTVYNPFYDISNNLVSAWLARAEMTNDFVLLNGDVVFNPQVLARLVASRNGDIQMVIDRKDQYDDDDMKVTTEGNAIMAVSKRLPVERAGGESIGMIAFRGRGPLRFTQTLDAMVREPENRNVFYLAALQTIMDSGVPVGFVECEPNDWAEIDFHPDLRLIRENIRSFDERVLKWSRTPKSEP